MRHGEQPKTLKATGRCLHAPGTFPEGHPLASVIRTRQVRGYVLLAMVGTGSVRRQGGQTRIAQVTASRGTVRPAPPTSSRYRSTVSVISIIVPVVYAMAGGESARRTLEGWKSWLGANNAAVMTVLLVVMGVALLGKGLCPLIG